MAEQEDISDPRTESLTDKISDKIHGDGDVHTTSSSSSDSEHEDKKMPSESDLPCLGRQKPVHKVFGGRKPADILIPFAYRLTLVWSATLQSSSYLCRSYGPMHQFSLTRGLSVLQKFASLRDHL